MEPVEHVRVAIAGGTSTGKEGAIGVPILAAWNARKTCSTCSRPPAPTRDRETVARLLHRFYTRCAETDLPELHRLATTTETWWPQIHAFLTTGITNAGTEGTNRVIKTIGRDASGFRNPENQRLRTRTAATADTSTPLNFEEPVWAVAVIDNHTVVAGGPSGLITVRVNRELVHSERPLTQPWRPVIRQSSGAPGGHKAAAELPSSAHPHLVPWVTRAARQPDSSPSASREASPTWATSSANSAS